MTGVIQELPLFDHVTDITMRSAGNGLVTCTCGHRCSVAAFEAGVREHAERHVREAHQAELQLRHALVIGLEPAVLRHLFMGGYETYAAYLADAGVSVDGIASLPQRPTADDPQ